MNNKQIVRAYSINEVSQKLNIPTGTIRQWEKDLNGLLNIPRTQQGARYYTDHEIMTLAKIKEMREQNVSKGMIRTLLAKYLNNGLEPHSESLELAIRPAQALSNERQKRFKHLIWTNLIRQLPYLRQNTIVTGVQK